MLRIASCTAITFGLMAGTSLAADLPQPVQPIQPEISYETPATYDWSGGYVGANAGWGFLGADGKNGAPGALDENQNGVTGGVHAGYNFTVAPSVVLGAEADIQYNDLEERKDGVELNSDWNASVRGRAGYAFDRTLVYGTGGVAFKNLTAKSSAGKDDKNVAGYVVGAGVERAVSDTLTARVEYLYQDFGDQKFDFAGTTEKTKLDENLIRAGVSMKF
ncbi:OmpA-like transmembrane domain protein [Pseudovibrio axinellae]|uniref:OmpA-like transmembrane domain protein n=1 Tax=Pseudovibrio axinellae TaxID=989403 RepID=A0A166AV75_9HYPH|nr:outer membrane protein [Pseudovibrio axinellae]KZL21592.1 OmpA-like transmembrane domain protein [Pseudovibrio axinellae]SER10866.1 outer membrane immunogenic protein [Pseudovibrio axinellae]